MDLILSNGPYLLDSITSSTCSSFTTEVPDVKLLPRVSFSEHYQATPHPKFQTKLDARSKRISLNARHLIHAHASVPAYQRIWSTAALTPVSVFPYIRVGVTHQHFVVCALATYVSHLIDPHSRIHRCYRMRPQVSQMRS